MLGKKNKGSKKVLVLKNFGYKIFLVSANFAPKVSLKLGQYQLGKFQPKKNCCVQKNLGETKCLAKILRFTKIWAKKDW